MEWREAYDTDTAATSQKVNDTSSATGTGAGAGGSGNSGRPILMLPFPSDDILLQGQSTTIILKEGRFYDLFQDCIDDHQSIVGMAIMADDGLVMDGMPLCEIVNFDVEAGYRGKVTVCVTLRAVGRATIVELTQMRPIMMGTCVELMDDAVSDGDALAVAKDLVCDIQSTIGDMNSSFQRRFESAFDLALEHDAIIRGYVSSRETGVYSIKDITAASWAVFGCCIPSNMLLEEALVSTSVTNRLRLGLKALLDVKYQTNGMREVDEIDDVVGFE